MPNNIYHKRNANAGVVPTAAQLTVGEIALNTADGKAYTRTTAGTVVELTEASVADGGEQFTPLNISNLALWLDGADTTTLFQSDVSGVTAVSSPADVAGLVDWYDATDTSTVTLSGNKITSWASRVVGGRTLTQGNDSLRPVMENNIQNGLRMAKFDGVDDRLKTATPEVFGDKTVFVVSLPTNVTATQAVWASSRQNATLYGYYYTLGFRAGTVEHLVRLETVTSNPRSTATTNNQITLVCHSFRSSEVVNQNYNSTVSRRDGISFTAGGSGTLLGDFTVGSTMGANDGTASTGNFLNFYSGYVGEVLVYDAYLSDLDRARVERYLVNKWGVALAPATATNDPVGAWRDKSGNNRHATQATAASRPAYTAQGRSGKTVITFDGSNDFLTTPTLSITQPFTICWVGRSNGNASGQAVNAPFVCDGTASNTRVIVGWNADGLSASNGRLAMFAGTSLQPASGTQAYNAWSAVTAVFNETSSRLRVEGLQLASGAAGATNISALRLGQRFETAAAPTAFNGPWGEFLIYSAALSTAQCRAVEQYLADKWGITLAPQVSNADAQDWINRVYQNAGTVSQSTAAAVNNFCNAINAAGIRDRFYRLNLFCGDNLAACLVPLYRGQSLGGTQFGNTTDTNNNFAASDYNERGTTGGLIGNGSSKYLATGFAANLLTVGDRHISAYVRAIASGNFSASLGSSDFGGSFWLRRRFGNDQFAFDAGAGGIDQNAVDVGFLMGVNSGAGAGVLYRNGNAISSATGQTIATPTSAPIHIFARSTGTGGGATDFSSARLTGYSIGVAMTAAQVAAFNTATQAFQTTLARNV